MKVRQAQGRCETQETDCKQDPEIGSWMRIVGDDEINAEWDGKTECHKGDSHIHTDQEDRHVVFAMDTAGVREGRIGWFISHFWANEKTLA